MTILVRAKPNSKKESVEKLDDDTFVVAVKEPPVEGRANKAIIRALAEYFGVDESKVKILAGHTSRIKTIDIHTPS